MSRHSTIGKRFCRLTVLKLSHKIKRKNGSNSLYFLCKCDCGNEKAVSQCNLISNQIKSCGCLLRETRGQSKITHGFTRGGRGSEAPKEYKAWVRMKVRCYNKNIPDYRYYGGKGIKVCERWKNSFKNFYEDLGPIPSKKHTLDRINGKKDYSPENCRWATRLQQSNNLSTNIIIKFRNKLMTMAEVSRATGINYYVLKQNIGKQRKIEDIIYRYKNFPPYTKWTGIFGVAK